MQKRILPVALVAISLLSFIGWNCTKLDTTDVGSDLLTVDNINTFDTSLLVNSTQGFFNDSTYIGRYDDYAVGAITNDPLFGQSSASIYMQLKPPYYPYYFGNIKDTITGPGVGIDSVVLCLKYKGFWGDSLLPVHLEVREVNDFIFRDSTEKEVSTAYRPNVMGAILASADIDVRTMGNVIKFNNGRDSVTNQIRIKLPAAWAAQLFARDSSAGNSINNAFYSDSVYRRFYNGLAVIGGGGGNGFIYTNLADTATKLEIHYRKKNGGAVDSVYTSFRFNPAFGPTSSNAPGSNAADYIVRNRAGNPIASPAADEHYLQAAPGTFVSLKIPGLAGLSNRIVHRAEVIVEQIPTDPVLDEKLSAPNFLYLDLKDSGVNNNYKPIYIDLNTTEYYDPDYLTSIRYFPSSIDYGYYGGFRKSKNDVFSTPHKYYVFNVTRYVQQIVTKKAHVYDMRVYAPFNLNYAQYSETKIPFANNIAFGRVRIGSGANPNYRLRLRIIYSNLK